MSYFLGRTDDFVGLEDLGAGGAVVTKYSPAQQYRMSNQINVLSRRAFQLQSGKSTPAKQKELATISNKINQLTNTLTQLNPPAPTTGGCPSGMYPSGGQCVAIPTPLPPPQMISVTPIPSPPPTGTWFPPVPYVPGPPMPPVLGPSGPVVPPADPGFFPNSGVGRLGRFGDITIQTPYGPLVRTKTISMTNCPDLFARAQLNFNLAAKHDNNFSTYQTNMNLRYSQYQQCATASNQPVYQLDTSADPTALPNGVGIAAAVPTVGTPSTALQLAAAVAGGALTPYGTTPTPSALQAQAAAQPPISLMPSKTTLIEIGVGFAALVVLILVMKSGSKSSSAPAAAAPVPKV